MNIRERAWRRRVQKVVRLLDERIAGSEGEEPIARARMIWLRERLAGALGAEEGYTSTPELRLRAAKDLAEAENALGTDGAGFIPPRGSAVEKLMERGLASFRPVWPERGDRR